MLCIKREPIEGEPKVCSKSLGILISFAISKLGKNIQVLSSSFVSKQEQYTVEGLQNLGDKAIMCFTALILITTTFLVSPKSLKLVITNKSLTV